MSRKLKRKNSNFSVMSDLTDDFSVDDSIDNNASVWSTLNESIIQSAASSNDSPSIPSELFDVNLLILENLTKNNQSVNSLTADNLSTIALLGFATDMEEDPLSAVDGVPTAGLFNIFPTKVLRRSKGEVKITNTNLQSSNKEPIEVLLSTITPTYTKDRSEIYPSLITIIDKIFDKIVSCPDQNAQNAAILDLIEVVKNNTADLDKIDIPS